jgi:hypothetical protein
MVEIQFKALTTVTVAITEPVYSKISSVRSKYNKLESFRRWDGEQFLIIEKKTTSKGVVSVTLTKEIYKASLIKSEEASEQILGKGKYALTKEEFYTELKAAIGPFLATMEG